MAKRKREYWRIVKVNFKPYKRGQKIPLGATMTLETANGSTRWEANYPPRPADMSPVQYHRKYNRVDDRFLHVYKGRYYCNPAHCSRSWKDKKERDKHLDQAYGLL